MELLTQPKLLFLDEPTAGLDSVTALSLVHVLKGLTTSGACTVLCTISQPAATIFELFDDLILLSKGRIVYNGRARDVVQFFASKGFPCPPLTNPADHLIDILVTDSSRFIDDTQLLSTMVPGDGFADPRPHTPLPVNFRRQPWIRQFLVLFHRSWTDVTRNRVMLFTQFIQTVIIAVLIGTVFLQIGHNQSSIVRRNPVLFFCVVNQGVFGAMMMINSFPEERILVLRERAAGTYHVSAYFMSKLAADIPNILSPMLFSVIVYWLVGLQANVAKFFMFMVFMILCTLAATSYALMVSTLCRTATLSTSILPTVLEICRLFGGFFLSPANIPGYFKWLDTLSYCKYSYVGIALNELQGLTLTCLPSELVNGACPITSGQTTINSLGLNQYTIGGCVGGLALIIVISRIIAYLALRFLK
jgi:ATP-binding cassette subfamily G (WHITE) protein 2